MDNTVKHISIICILIMIIALFGVPAAKADELDDLRMLHEQQNQTLALNRIASAQEFNNIYSTSGDSDIYITINTPYGPQTTWAG